MICNHNKPITPLSGISILSFNNGLNYALYHDTDIWNHTMYQVLQLDNGNHMHMLLQCAYDSHGLSQVSFIEYDCGTDRYYSLMNEFNISKSLYKTTSIEDINYSYDIPCVYSITNIINGMIYIGCTNNLYNRIREHRSHLKSNSHSNNPLQLDYNKYGVDCFGVSIIEEVRDDNKRFDIERQQIATLSQSYYLYNMWSMPHNALKRD